MAIRRTNTTDTLDDYNMIDILNGFIGILTSGSNVEVLAMSFTYDKNQGKYTVSMNYDHDE